MLTERSGRRDFLRWGFSSGCALGVGGIARRAAAASAESPRAKNAIMIFLTGGPGTIDLWDLKPDAPDRVRGEFRPIETSAPGVRICEHLPRLAEQMRRVALVRSVTHTIAEHTQGQAYMMTGNRPGPTTDFPSLGAMSAALLPVQRGTPRYVTLGPVPSANAGELGAAYHPLEITLGGGSAGVTAVESIGLPDGFAPADLTRREQLLAKIEERFEPFESAPVAQRLSQFQHDALELLRSDKIRKALDLTREPEPIRERYGESRPARGALVARRLIEAGARFVTLGFGDWDTHDNHFTRLRGGLLPQLDQTLAALIADLAERGMLDETLVYCAGEFGRTPFVNENAGRDHWSKAMSVLLAGGGLRPGVVGATDEHAAEPIEQACSPDDVSATLFHQLGFKPQAKLTTPSGRESPLFRSGAPIRDLI
jgi:hypothetical protein